MDLTDPTVRAAVTARLSTLYAGRRVVLCPMVLAGATPTVRWLNQLGCAVLVLTTVRGAGEVPRPDECQIVEVPQPAAGSVSEELRALDGLAHHLPAVVVDAVEAFDPERRAVWRAGPFVTSDQPILGRPVLSGRPAAYLALEDKVLAEWVWAACGVPTAPHRVLPVDQDALAAATTQIAGPLGAVWSGDARDGFNGGGDYVRWVRDDHDAAAALAFFAPRCDRVRVMPFLDGVPCSIHGIVLPDGTAAMRPVEIAMLRDTGSRRLVYGGLSSWWDPPADDREEMRTIAKRVGAHLARAHDYRGAFGIDGVLTVDGFRPTELNTRFSAGLTAVAGADPIFFQLLQDHLLAGLPTGLTVADLESLVPLADAERSGSAVAIGTAPLGVTEEFPVTWDGTTLTRAEQDTGSDLRIGDTASGFFSQIKPCALLAPGDRLAPLNVALMAFLNREYDAGFPPVSAAPDVR